MPEVFYNSFNTIKGGVIRISCDKNDERAEKEEYNKKDGSVGYTYFRPAKGWSGKLNWKIEIKNNYRFLILDFYDLKIELIEFNPCFIEFLSKVPNINFNQDVEIKPFVDKKERDRIGILQNGQIIENFFYRKELNGLPNWELEQPQGSEAIKNFFNRQKEFIINFVTKQNLISDEEIPVIDIDEDINSFDNQEEEIKIEDVPF